jgi:hypothetical protein
MPSSNRAVDAAALVIGAHAPRLSRRSAILVASAALLVIALGDCLTSWYYLFDFFYLLPLSIATIYDGRRSGFAMALAATLAWMVGMVVQGHPLVMHALWPGALVWAWNFVARLTVQSAFVWLLARLRDDIVRQSQLVADLQDALEQVQQLRTLIPICAWCKKIRDDAGYWKQLEHYMQERDLATFTHGICPECASNLEKD